MNRKLIITSTIIVGVVAAIALIASAGPDLRSPLNLGVDVTFELTPKAGTFTASAEMTDLGSGEVLSAPRITGRLGQEAVARSGIQTEAGSEEIRLTLWADQVVATYRLEVIRAGEVVLVMKSTVHH